MESNLSYVIRELTVKNADKEADLTEGGSHIYSPADVYSVSVNTAIRTLSFIYLQKKITTS